MVGARGRSRDAGRASGDASGDGGHHAPSRDEGLEVAPLGELRRHLPVRAPLGRTVATRVASAVSGLAAVTVSGGTVKVPASSGSRIAEVMQVGSSASSSRRSALPGFAGAHVTSTAALRETLSPSTGDVISNAGGVWAVSEKVSFPRTNSTR